MNPVTLYPFYILIIATFHLFTLTRPGEAFPINLTIPSFLPYLPKSHFTWSIGDAKLQIPNTRNKNSDQKRNNPDKANENSSDEDWDWTVLPPSVWKNLLTARNPKKYQQATESGQVTEPSRITKSSKPALIAITKPNKTLNHHHRHSRKHHRRSQTKGVLYFVVEDQVQSATTTDIPTVQKTTKLARNRNPLCYFTALPCAD